MKIHEKVIKFREERGWSQEVLEEKSEIPLVYIDLLEKGRFSPSEMEIERLEEVFGLDPGTLVDDEE